MPLISREAPAGWKPRPGDLVTGRKGKREIEGEIVADPRRPRLAKIRSFRGGFVAYFLLSTDGREHAVNEVRP